MKKNNERVNPGYKMTPLGVIPEDWEQVTVSKCFKFVKSYPISRDGLTRSNYDSATFCIHYGDIHSFYQTAFLDFSTQANIPQIEGNKNNLSEKDYLIDGDIVMADVSEDYEGIGKNVVVMNIGGKIAVGGLHTIVLRCIDNSVDKYFSAHIFDGEAIRNELRKKATGISVYSVSKASLNALLLNLPPISEQKAIAKILSTWDEAIDKTRQLIEQKELRKKALMQQLLTGKKRLKGFTGEWRWVRLGSVFSEILTTNNGGDHEVMTISARRGFISQNAKFNRVIAGDSLGKYKLILYHDFAYNKGNSITYKMGCIYRLEDQESAVVPFVYICFRSTPQVCSNFYKHWFLASGLDRQLNRIITSGARSDGLLNVNSQDFFALRVIYPTLEEQKAIGEILQKADEELILEKQKLEQLKLQKKSLMQVLLTGKKRTINLTIDITN